MKKNEIHSKDAEHQTKTLIIDADNAQVKQALDA